MKHTSVLIAVALTFAVTGCFSKIQHLPAQVDVTRPVFAPLPEQDTLLVGLAVSGGGSRAATFAAGALEALEETVVQQGTTKRSVLAGMNSRRMLRPSRLNKLSPRFRPCSRSRVHAMEHS